MIIKKKRAYLGLETVPVYITDTSPNSFNYLKLDDIPDELTAGKNIIKILGNSRVFKQNSPILVEILDSRGNTVYVEFPNYFDSLKRRLIVVEVTEDTAPGPALITICSILRDELVPLEFVDQFNFKWQSTINISPFRSNTTEIIYTDPPVVELQTRIRPYITTSYRNNEEMITREYGEYEYYDFIYRDHDGDSDGSNSIFQTQDVNRFLNSYTTSSITSFDRDNVFYLKPENYSAKTINRNYPIVQPGKNSYATFGQNILPGEIGTFNSSPSSYWTNSGNLYGGSSPRSQTVIRGTTGNEYIGTEVNTSAGQYYLVAVDSNQTAGTAYDFSVALGYDSNRNSGSISEGVRVAATGQAATTGWETVYTIVRASDAGRYLWLFFGTSIGNIDNIRIFPLTYTDKSDFKLETDTIGGLLKIHHPNISPQTSSGLSLYQTDGSYTSYVNFLLRDQNAAANGTFMYDLVSAVELETPTTFNVKKHKIERFTSNAELDQIQLSNNFVDRYQLMRSFSDPYGAYLLTSITVGPNGIIYGPVYEGGQANGGGIFSYDPETNALSTVHYFNTSKYSGRRAETKMLYLSGGPNKGLYGTTSLGGRFDSGSLFRYDPDSGIVTKIHDFGRTGDPSNSPATFTTNSGWAPFGPVMQASNGLLYGTTARPIVGGLFGTIYSFNTSSFEHKVLQWTGSFGSKALIQSGGFLYGVKPYTGGQGAIFRLEISTNTLTDVYTLAGSDGYDPASGLMRARDGFFYGATFTGSAGSGNGGTIFRFDPATAAFTKLFDLDKTLSGSECERPLFEDSGYFYGLCNAGGTYGNGTLFRFSTSSLTFEVIEHFLGAPSGRGAKSSIVRVGDYLYSNNTQGGVNDTGTIFRIERVGLKKPYVKKEAGIIYHHNAILPRPIPATSSLLIDYPRWTGPVKVSESDLYSVVELEIKGLEPISGDVSKVKLSAKPQGLKGEFTDLGTYSTKPVDILLDNNYVNHVHFIDSPYRLTGYFKPIVTSYASAVLESNSFRGLSFASGWVSASITESNYFKGNQTFLPSMSIRSAPELNLGDGACLTVQLNNTPTENMLSCMIYTASSIPPGTSSLDLWEQISYNLYSAAPFPAGLNITASDWYTSSIGYNVPKFNEILVYSGLVSSTGSTLSLNDVYAISDKISYNWSMSGSSLDVSSSLGHPLTFNNKLGWITDTFFVTRSIASSTQSLYPAIFFEYNTFNQSVFSSSITSTRPHVVEITNFSCREVGDRDYMINKYWESSVRNPDPTTRLAGVPYTPSNNDKLSDSVKLTVYDGVWGVTSSLGSAYKNKNKVLFRTADSYKFYKGVPYILSFNAFSEIKTINGLEPATNLINLPYGTGQPGWSRSPAGDWSGATGYKSFNFGNTTSGYINLNDVDFYDGYVYEVEITTGAFTYFPGANPTTLSLISGSYISSIQNIQPNTTYKLYYTQLGTITTGPRIQLDSTFTDSNATVYINSAIFRRFNYDFKDNTILDPVLPLKSKLKTYGINTLFGVPFADQLTTSDPGEFIGELEHKLEYGLSGETKYFGRIEMEFAPETDGFGNIGFETDLGADWYISDISIRPKDRVGLTPAATRLFIKLPNELVNKVLTFRVEYLNDENIKAPYATLLNDIVFTNKDESISKSKGSLNSSEVAIQTGNTSVEGPNTGQGGGVVDPGDISDRTTTA